MREGAISKHVSRFFMYAFLVIVSFISVFPLYWAFISSCNNTQQILGGRMIPSTHLMENLRNLFAQQDVLTALKNSFATTLLQVVLSLAIMVPFVAVLVPLFQLFSKMGLLNTWAGFFLPSLATPFLIMYFRNSARTFPKDTIEAARIDGLNEFQIFVRMFVPMMKPTYAAAATITFMNAWNSYLWPKVIMQTSNATTMPMLVSNLMGGYVIDYGVVMAGVTICSLPTVIIFFCLQKSFTNAVAGAVK